MGSCVSVGSNDAKSERNKMENIMNEEMIGVIMWKGM